MKVLHLPIILCNQPSEITLALTRAGIKADYAVLDTNDQEWLLTENNIRYNLHTTDIVKNDPDMKKIRKSLYRFFLLAIKDYDIFHFHSNISLFSSWLGHFEDLEILKKAGKKIVVSYWGCDIRQKSKNLKYKYNTCKVCNVPCDEKEKIYIGNNFAKMADLTIAHMPELIEYAPKGSIFLPAFIDTDFWKPSRRTKKDSDIFKIIHIFGNSQSRGDVRGTEFVRKAVEKLKKEGLKIEFLFFDKVPHGQLKNYYEAADLVIEQLKYGTYGLTALEAMALEVPVMGYVREKYDRYYHNELPIIRANPETITDVLRETVQNRKNLVKIGRDGRKYVVKYHNSDKVAGLLIKEYKKILKKKSKPLVSMMETANQARRAIGFKVLLMTPRDLTGNNVMKNEAQKLIDCGYKTTIMGYALPNSDTSIPEYNNLNGYESFRFCYEFTPPYFRFYDFLGLLRVHPPETKIFSKMTILGKIFNAITLFINNILYNNSFYSFRHYFLLTYQFYNKGSQMWPDIVYASDVSTLIAGCYIKKVTKCYLVYDTSKSNIQTKVKFSKLSKVIFNILEKIYLSKADVCITNNGVFAKKVDNKLSFKFQNKLKVKNLSDIFDILLRQDL